MKRTGLLLMSLFTLFAGTGAGIAFQVFAISFVPDEYKAAAWGFCMGLWFMTLTLGTIMVLGLSEPVKPDEQK